MKYFTRILAGLAFAISVNVAVAAELKEITIAYFNGWPLPIMAYKNTDKIEKAMGVKVNWVAFETGTAMSAAMASGDVHLALSQGLPPFVVAVSGGQDLQLIDVAVSYSDNDNCVVRADLEIDKTNAGELAGKKVAVPLGTAPHYGLLRQMNHFNVPINSLKIVDMDPPTGAAALAQGEVDMACGFNPGLTRMKEHGNVLLTGAEKESLGILVFDITSGPADFIAENEDLVAKFLKIKNDATRVWNKGLKKGQMIKAIAAAVGMDVAAASNDIATMKFPSAKQQLTKTWLGGNVAPFMKGVADVFVEAKSIDSALSSYESVVNSAPLEAAIK